MSKLTRYNTIMGPMCYAADVEQLEATNAELLEAAERVVERWDSPHWGWSDEHTSVMIHQLRAAIAKAQGEVME